MIGGLTLTLDGETLHVTATTERGCNPETGAAYVDKLTTFLSQPNLIAEVFGCTVAELTVALMARKARALAGPIIVNTPAAEGEN